MLKSGSIKPVFVLAGILIILVFTGYSGALNNSFVDWDDKLMLRTMKVQ
jgi:hypothetical protein